MSEAAQAGHVKVGGESQGERILGDLIVGFEIKNPNPSVQEWCRDGKESNREGTGDSKTPLGIRKEESNGGYLRTSLRFKGGFFHEGFGYDENGEEPSG